MQSYEFLGFSEIHFYLYFRFWSKQKVFHFTEIPIWSVQLRYQYFCQTLLSPFWWHYLPRYYGYSYLYLRDKIFRYKFMRYLFLRILEKFAKINSARFFKSNHSQKSFFQKTFMIKIIYKFSQRDIKLYKTDTLFAIAGHEFAVWKTEFSNDHDSEKSQTPFFGVFFCKNEYYKTLSLKKLTDKCHATLCVTFSTFSWSSKKMYQKTAKASKTTLIGISDFWF